MASVNQWTRTVRLHGAAAELFGEVHQLAVESVGEAVRALNVNTRGRFFRYLRETSQQGLGFAVLARKAGDSKVYSLGEDTLRCGLGSMELHFVPMPQGAGDSPILRIVLGVVLVAVAIVAGPAGWAFSGVGAGWLTGGMAGLAAGMGASLALSGVATLITGTPAIGFDDQQKAEGAESRPSYAFSGAVNTAAQGRPVPIGYGELLVGSHVLSAGIRNE